MTEPGDSQSRRLQCARCGTSFECAPGSDCWCAAEPFRLPMPDNAKRDTMAEDCLCPACLRAAAAAQHG